MDVKGLFRETFRATPTAVIRAPGRLELLGNHTDYNQGLVMSLAIDRELFMAVAPRNDGRVEVVSSVFPGRHSFYADAPPGLEEAPWLKYIQGVLQCLRKRGLRPGGFNAALHSTIPLGAGLSSSAALEVATALAVRNLYPFGLTRTGIKPPPVKDRRGRLPPPDSDEKLALADLCREAENDYVGVQCGFLDQVSCLFGREHEVMQIDCRHRTVDYVPFAPELAVVVCDSGVKRELVAGEYNQRRQHCESSVRKLRVESLRRVNWEDLEAKRAHLSEREYQCASHVVGEIRRVVAGERALRSGDAMTFGQLLFQSHESSRDRFLNSCPELDLLVELARQHSACAGARLTGGGFGGATINIVQRAGLEDFVEQMRARYQEKTGRMMQPLSCRIVDGASVVS